eukprot:CAMPEP_0194770648 /NCGR_PEP_ID=MMETSP0323_2-20130528/46801_1 /TAXON_ID=2866 ORGANISM="Crypthecodinium cohnii, Strain Seligo" /NCGR_SAMPLE_ID=MMETSP0323_2 /ASSEMBLY_ACC=CAM_ASM_000346 /LENGTH=102 /DNA_ID=CAMNT_0039704303 /DNA_START=167 /DNA_END=475 /DNA_ORIENTATION=-
MNMLEAGRFACSSSLSFGSSLQLGHFSPHARRVEDEEADHEASKLQPDVSGGAVEACLLFPRGVVGLGRDLRKVQLPSDVEVSDHRQDAPPSLDLVDISVQG